MMVARVRGGFSERAVARSFRVSLSTVQRWVARAGDTPLAEVDWKARPAGCRVSARRTKPAAEQRVLAIRKQLRTQSDLGEYGPEAIRRELQDRNARHIPSIATIARILSRRGALDGRQRVRRRLRRRAGTCPTWPPHTSSWTASTPSRIWSFAAAST